MSACRLPGQDEVVLWVVQDEGDPVGRRRIMSPEKLVFAQWRHHRYQAVVVRNVGNMATHGPPHMGAPCIDRYVDPYWLSSRHRLTSYIGPALSPEVHTHLSFQVWHGYSTAAMHIAQA